MSLDYQQRYLHCGKTGYCRRQDDVWAMFALTEGNLYGYVEKQGFNKIALGHHHDDILEILFLNMFNGGKLGAMPPKLRSDDGKNTVIRPLAYCTEKDIETFAEVRDYPIIPCSLCGSQEHLQRQQIKQMIEEWRHYPGRIENIFRAICNVAPSQLADTKLFDFDNFVRIAGDDCTGQISFWGNSGSGDRTTGGRAPGELTRSNWIHSDPR